ncbi:MAG: hypothetical protein ABEN55_09465 [Bradymonadaceae bacterium]
MPRSADDIAEELKNLAPGWFLEAAGEVLLDAFADVLASAEGRLDAWTDQLFRETADDAYLQDLGRDRGKGKRPWESDAEFGERAYIEPQAPTPDRLQELLDELLEFEGYCVQIEEPHLRPMAPGEVQVSGSIGGATTPLSKEDAGEQFFLGDRMAPQRAPRLFVVRAPIPETRRYESGTYLVPERPSVKPDLTDAYLSTTPRSEARRQFRHLQEAMEELHPHGCAWALEIEDSVELAHYDQLLGASGAIGG